MINPPLFIVDASVALKWFKAKDEANVGEARKLMNDMLDQKVRLSAPHFLYYEMINAARYDKEFSEEIWQTNLLQLFTLPLEIEALDQTMARDIYVLAKKLGLSTYDTTYLILAQRFETKVITADRELLTKAPDLTKSL